MSDADTPRLLFVSDDAVTSQALRLALSADHLLEVAPSAEQALELVRSESPPELILVSTSCENIDGYALCRTLKEDRKTQTVPVIFVRASEAPENETLGLQAGAVDHLTTPFEMATAKARIRAHLELKWLREHAESALSLDPLTELPDQLGVEEFLVMEWGRAIRESSPTSLILVDIDSFAAYNEARGRQAGDDCLRQVATQLASTVRRPMDFLGRYGNDLFAAVLPSTDGSGAAYLAERMRVRVQALGLSHPESEISKNVTACTGAATAIPTRDSTADLLINVARRALEDAKKAGGNAARNLEVA